MILLPYLLFSSLMLVYGVDRYRFKGPKYQAPETTEAIKLFRQKCIEFKVDAICAYGFQNLVRVDITDYIIQVGLDPNIRAIGVAEFSIFSPLTKISIDRKITVDRMLLHSTVIHELGHAVLGLNHDDSKLAIMNSEISSYYEDEQTYEFLINDMFKDFAKSLH